MCDVTQDHLIPPAAGSQAIEEAQKLFDQMQRAHSAFSKMELLLQAVRITYDNVSQHFNHIWFSLNINHTKLWSLLLTKTEANFASVSNVVF